MREQVAGTLANVVLVSPEIPYNTGNIIRICANTGSRLHLVEPIGFGFEDAKLRRAALDYHDLTNLTKHESIEELFSSLVVERTFAAVTDGFTAYSAPEYRMGDTILFGSESVGLSADVLCRLQASQLIQIPMAPSNRSLNLSNAVAVIVYEMWRQLGFKGSGGVVKSDERYFS